MMIRGVTAVLLFIVFCCFPALGGEKAKRFNTSPYEKRLEKIQADEECSPNQRDLAGKIIRALQQGNFNASINLLDRLASSDRDSPASLEANLILFDFLLRVKRNPMQAQRQFLRLTEEQKNSAVEHWLNHSKEINDIKDELIRGSCAVFLSYVGDWAARSGNPNAQKIHLLAASLFPKDTNNKNNSRQAASAYEQAALVNGSVEEREQAIFEMARVHLESDRFTEAIASLRRITRPESLPERFSRVIDVCLSNPDSHAALLELQREKSFSPIGPLRSRFDVAIAEIYIREELYDEAAVFLISADEQYSYLNVMDDLKKRFEREQKASEGLAKRIAERIQDLNQGKKGK